MLFRSTFNTINLSVYEKCLNSENDYASSLYELIEPVSDEDIDDQVGILQEKMDTLEGSEEITEEIQEEIDTIYGEISDLENERDSLND